MELIIAVVVIAVVVWYFGKLLNTGVDAANSMAARKLKYLDREQKATYVQKYGSMQVDNEAVTKAAGNAAAIDAFDI